MVIMAVVTWIGPYPHDHQFWVREHAPGKGLIVRFDEAIMQGKGHQIQGSPSLKGGAGAIDRPSPYRRATGRRSEANFLL